MLMLTRHDERFNYGNHAPQLSLLDAQVPLVNLITDVV